jgi:hypothetical protein
MNSSPKPSVPGWYWAIAVVALLWNVMGCAALATELFAQESAMASMTEPQKEWVRSIPAWVYIVYGVAVATGVAGSVGLLMRKGWAVELFAVCLVAVLIQMVDTMVILGGLKVMGAQGAIMPALVIVLTTVFLGFAWSARGKGWIGANQATISSAR